MFIVVMANSIGVKGVNGRTQKKNAGVRFSYITGRHDDDDTRILLLLYISTRQTAINKDKYKVLKDMKIIK